jgi:integrase
LARGVKIGLIKYNPAREVKYLHNVSIGFRTLTWSEIAQFQAYHAIGTQARLAMSLILFLGQQKSDAVRFGRQHIRGGKFHFTQAKNRSRRPVDLTIPMANELQKVIDLTPKENLRFLVTQWGRPFIANGFGNKFRKWCDEAGLPQCSSHGLRKACATILAELGCSEMQIRAITGHRTANQVSVYTREENLAVLATQAIAKLDQHMAELHHVPPNETVADGGTDPLSISLKSKGRDMAVVPRDVTSFQ